MDGFPIGWVAPKFTEILDINGGTQPPKKEFIYEPKKGFIRLLQIRDFGKKPAPTYIFDNGKRRVCEKNDILIGRYGASVGRICTGLEGAYNVALAKVVKPKEIHAQYLKFYLESEHFQIPLTMISRSAQNGFNKQDLSEMSFLVPPQNEQTRIANKLDSLLAKVDAAQTRLDKIPTLLKRFRQAVLAAATSGELTKEWRINKELIKVADIGLWKTKDIPETWEVKKLPEFSESRLGKMLDKSKNSGVPSSYLGNINVRWNKFELSNLKVILVSKEEIELLSIKNGDLLICEGGEPGRTAIWKNGENELVFQKALHRVRLDKTVLPEFCLYNLKNDTDNKKLHSLYTGTTIKHLTGASLKKYPIRIPPIEEQKQIVHQVESLFTLADKVEKQYQQARLRTDKLTQSLLAKAFKGELVPQDPNDEPAEKLLSRIQAEKEKLKPVKKSRKPL